METIIYSAFVYLGLISIVFGQEDIDRVQHIRSCLQIINEKANAKKITPDTPQFLVRIPEFNALQNEADTIWEDALKNLSSVAPDGYTKSILISSFEGLSPENYLAFLNRALDMYNTQQIDKWEFLQAMGPVGRLNGLLDDNYRDPRVMAILEKAKKAFSNDPREVEVFNSMLSGKNKQMLDQKREAFRNLPGEAPPIVKLSAPGSVPGQKNLNAGSVIARNIVSSDSSGGHSSQPTITAVPIITQVTAETPAQLSFAWIVVGAIVLIIGGLFAWKKLS